MQVRKPLILTFALCLLVQLAFCQADTLLNKLKAFNQARPAEKAYLHFDKPYYAAGDTIYFKAYVTMGERHVPSRISGVLHVDLVNTKSKIDQSIKLQLANGIAWGDFALPDSLPKGNYRVRAWTRWMRNDPGSFFEKTIAVGSLQGSKIAEIKAINARPDVQFFPEGGTLVAGIKTRIAFKAIGPTGLGIPVHGVIMDNDDKEVTSFAAFHLGMGSFELAPGFNKNYRAKLTFADGTTQTIDLPKAEKKGIALSVDNDSIASAKVSLKSNEAYFNENKGKTCTLLIYSGGIANTIAFPLDSMAITLQILKRKLFTGITRITLFSPGNEPLCERLIFVQNYDQLSLNITTDKPNYHPREKVTLKLSAKTRADSAAIGHFSVAVTDESKVPNDENSETTMLTNLLLTSDLEGYIEQPNYYFNRISDTTAKALDLVMLTHGYRRFEWKEVLNNNPKLPAYQPENGIIIKGVAKSIFGKPLNRGTVSLITVMGGPVLSQKTEGKGNFEFTNLVIFDTTRCILNATNARGSNATQLTLQPEPAPVIADSAMESDFSNAPDTVMKAYLKNGERQQEELNKMGIGKGRLLKEVKIKAIKRDDHYRTTNIFSSPGHADQVVHAKDIANMGGLLGDRLNGRLRGVVIYNGRAILHGFEPLRIMVDNMEVESLNIINPNDVETIEVFSSIAGPYMFITTKQGSGIDPKDIVSKGVLPITVMGFHRARVFYAPKYEHPGDNLVRKDLRSTIFWQPELATGKDGHGSLSFYNADGKGSYRVVVEGIDEKGNIGRSIYWYHVE